MLILYVSRDSVNCNIFVNEKMVSFMRVSWTTLSAENELKTKIVHFERCLFWHNMPLNLTKRCHFLHRRLEKVGQPFFRDPQDNIKRIRWQIISLVAFNKMRW